MNTFLYHRSTKYLAGASLALMLLHPNAAVAATFYITVPTTTVAPGSEVVAEVLLNTEGESVNAVEGSVLVPTELFDIVGVRTGSSLVTVWLESPVAPQRGAITFSGITPGGYRGATGQLFSLLLRAKGSGAGAFSFSGLQALKSDGNGTALRATGSTTPTSVKAGAPSAALPDLSDHVPPEAFQPSLIDNPDAFEGRKALAFFAQDKQSGVSHYDVCEGILSTCVSAQSPYVLRQQSADVLLKVSAVDNAGNVRTEYLFTSRAVMRYVLYAVLVTLFAMAVLFSIRKRRVQRQ